MFLISPTFAVEAKQSIAGSSAEILSPGTDFMTSMILGFFLMIILVVVIMGVYKIFPKKIEKLAKKRN